VSGCFVSVPSRTPPNAAFRWLALKKIRSAEELPVNSSGHGERFFIKWIVAVGVILVVAPIVNCAGVAAQVRYVDVSWFSQLALYLTVGEFAIKLCIMAFCLLALCKLYDPAVSTVD